MKLIFKVNKSIDTVFDYLTNMQKFTSVHPVISKINMVSDGKYLVYETLKFGFIPFSFTYPVTIKFNYDNKTIEIFATVFNVTNIEMNYKLEVANGLTIITENIQIKSFLPIVRIMESVFRKQHSILFKNIESLN
jgi:carbon monoxide dehydrogenase subunit G